MTAEEMVKVDSSIVFNLQMEKCVKATLIEDYPDIEEVLVGFQLAGVEEMKEIESDDLK